jgi:hypothetical protein
MGDHGKRKPDALPVDLSEPGAVIPLWYWRISPRAWLWEPAISRPAPARARRTPPIVAVMALAMLGAPARR